jgi:hypothetical protein
MQNHIHPIVTTPAGAHLAHLFEGPISETLIPITGLFNDAHFIMAMEVQHGLKNQGKPLAPYLHILPSS